MKLLRIADSTVPRGLFVSRGTTRKNRILVDWFLLRVSLSALLFLTFGSCSKKHSDSPTDPVHPAPTFEWVTHYESHSWSPVSLVASGSYILAIGQDSIYRSADGTRWSYVGGGLLGVSDAVSTGTTFIAVGGTIAYVSSDGSSWSSVTTPSAHTLNAVTWGANVAVAVGDSGTVLTSGNGATWVSRAAPTARHLRDVLWAGQAFWAVGDAGLLLTSPNGLTWTVVNAGLTANMGRIYWSGSLYLASGHDPQTSRSIISRSSDGVVWTTAYTSTTFDQSDCFQYSIVWSGTTYVAVGGGYCGAANRTTILTSPDGAAWISRVPPANLQGLRDVAWFKSRFVALCRQGTIVTSLDASGWAIALPGGECELDAAAYSGTQYVAVGSVSATSTDGITWTPRFWNRESTFLSTIAWSGATFAAGGGNGRIYTSVDGITWQDRSLNDTTVFIQKLLWLNNQFVGVGARINQTGSDEAVSIVSPDGTHWTVYTTGLYDTWLRSVAWQNGQYVAVGVGALSTYNQISVIATSPDGASWSRVNGGFNSNGWLENVASGRGKFVASGYMYGGVLVSSDGQTWSLQLILDSAGNHPVIRDVVFNGTTFYAFGEGVFRSATATAWEEIQSPNGMLTAEDGLLEILWTGNQFLMVHGSVSHVLIASSTETP